MTKNKELNLLYFLLFILILIIFGLGFYYFKITSPKTPSTTQISTPTPTPIPVVRKKEELPKPTVEPTTGKKILDIPIIFVVKSITDDEIILQKEGGKENEIARYKPKTYPVKVFKNLPPND